MNLTYEKSKLYDYLDNMIDELKDAKVFVAGGLITSLFCNREINDIDIYFRDKESFISFMYKMYNGSTIWSHTKKATLFVKDDKHAQLIHFKFFESAQDIFDTFDFTVCMGCFDFATEEFIFHPDFLRHNSQRILEFNPNTAYPIVSALRIQKYEKKGYRISKPEFLKVILACLKLQITSYDECKEHLGGMYGINYDKIFDTSKEFSLDGAIEQLSNLHLNEDYGKVPETLKFNDVDDIISSVLGEDNRYFKINNDYYKVKRNGSARYVSILPQDANVIKIDEFLDKKIICKFVKKQGDKYLSHYDSKFEYKIGEVSTAKRDSLWAGFIEDVRQFSYSSCDNSALIQLELPTVEDLQRFNSPNITAKRFKTVREIPKEEYVKYLDKSNDSIW